MIKHAEKITYGKLRGTVKSAVMTISTCAESDPRVQKSMDSLDGLDTNRVLEETVKYLDDEKNTIRRAAIYVLWKGKFENFSSAVPVLNKLCTHKESYTRGMAAIALGNTKEDSSFRLLCDMTLNDKDPYSRRCAAYALGLMGRADARDTLQKALADTEFNVRNNAESALTLIEQANKLASPSVKVPSAADKQAAERLSSQGWKLWRERKLAEAEKLFQQAVAKDPTNANAFNGLGWSQFNQGMALNAKASFEKCLAVESNHAAALNGLGWIAKNQGQTEEALGHWQQAVEAAPTATAALNGLTQTYMELKQYDEAAKYYELWYEVDPDNSDVKAGLEKVNKILKKSAPKTNSASLPVHDSFEVGKTFPLGWRPGASVQGVKYLWDKQNAHQGHTSLALHKSVKKYFPIAHWQREVLHQGSGEAIDVSVQVKAQNATKAIVDVIFYDAQGEWISHKWAAYIGAKEAGDPPANHDWKKYRGKVEIPKGTHKISFALQIYGPGKVWFDEFSAKYNKM